MLWGGNPVAIKVWWLLNRGTFCWYSRQGLGGLALLKYGFYTTASRSGVVVNIYPFFTAFFAHLLVGDRLGLGQWFGLLISFAGVVLLFWESLALAETQYLLGDAMVAASGLLLGLRQVVIKRLVQGLNPIRCCFGRPC